MKKWGKRGGKWWFLRGMDKNQWAKGGEDGTLNFGLIEDEH